MFCNVCGTINVIYAAIPRRGGEIIYAHYDSTNIYDDVELKDTIHFLYSNPQNAI